MSLLLDESERALVAATPLFSEIDADTLLWLLDGGGVTTYPDGGLLFSQGDAADRFFVVLAGRVSLFALTESGDQSIIEVVDKGASFAEGAIFANARFPLNAAVAPGTRLLDIPAASFLRRLSERQGLSAKLLASLARWQRHLMREIVNLKGRSPVQRLASYLLALSGPVADGAAEAVLPLSKTDLASLIGITPESLSRAVNRLKPIGVTSHGRSFRIADKAALRRFCGTD
ncbi:helix-turn-helix domain-containing protein [Telmatospirillum sp.]|uniref:Crp/Fnr family transcriptional regulator n=1 Tax=Telmatospirillum sp. TaxID=2079197 RepID=UPI00283CAB58|nr:helix-turn-helix domain-containing protein [Telmatospirillum sp.]MDR3441278.1 helix-turn-helix domain-containing protein [Telmatospirillum sp.]